MRQSAASGYKFVERFRVLDHPDYWAEVDEYDRNGDKLYFVHASFNKFTPEVWRRFRTEWFLFRTHTRVPLFAYRADKEHQVWEKFVERLGFASTAVTITCNNGEERVVYVSLPTKLDTIH